MRLNVKPIRMDITLQVGTDINDMAMAYEKAELYVLNLLSKSQIATFHFVDRTARRLSNNWCASEWEIHLQAAFGKKENEY